MNVDDLLWSLTDVDSITGKVRISKEAARAIGEALKAGLSMREDIEGCDWLSPGAKAWDAALINEHTALSQEIAKDLGKDV
jgi:hypothetical protein